MIRRRSLLAGAGAAALLLPALAGAHPNNPEINA
jgi:hypothetical protein